MAAIAETEDRTQEHADRPGDPEAVPQEAALAQAGRRREVRPHAFEQRERRLQRQGVSAGKVGQPAALAGERSRAGGDPVDVLRGAFDEVQRLPR